MSKKYSSKNPRPLPPLKLVAERLFIDPTSPSGLRCKRKDAGIKMAFEPVEGDR